MIRKNIDTEKLELLVTGNLILPFEREGFPGPATTNDTEGIYWFCVLAYVVATA